VTANGCVYATGADNELLSDGTHRYAYDADGNRTARFIDVNADGILDSGDTNVTEYKWDARNRLIEVTERAAFGSSATEVVDYLYDVENRWIGENVKSPLPSGEGQGEAWQIDRATRFAYDGDQIVLQFDHQLPSTSGGGAGGEGSAVTVADLSHRYLWQANAVDQLMADEQLSPLPLGEGQGEGGQGEGSEGGQGGYDRSQPGGVVWPLADQLGTVRDLAVYDSATATTAVANHRVYDSYGNLKSQTNAAVDCLFGFTGRPFDKATGQQNNLNRWYDAKTGGWMSKDPIGFTAGDTNATRYVGNSPTNATDASGTWWWPIQYFVELSRGSDLDQQLKEYRIKKAAGDPEKLAAIWNQAHYNKDILGDVRTGVGGAVAVDKAFMEAVTLGGIGIGRSAAAKASAEASAGRVVSESQAGRVAEEEAELHHLATNKNWISTLRGGPWSPRFQAIFEKAGMTLEDAANIVSIPGHFGPHSEEYHQYIFKRLTAAVEGLEGQAYKDALVSELKALAAEATKVGTALWRLLHP
jgi:RHS repeat-associated protein